MNIAFKNTALEKATEIRLMADVLAADLDYQGGQVTEQNLEDYRRHLLILSDKADLLRLALSNM